MQHETELDFPEWERALDLLHRAGRACAETTDPADMKEIRKWVWGYQCKFGPDPNPHPPHPKYLAQLLALATVDEIRNMILELMHEREPAEDTYAWYVRAAMKRVHRVEWIKDPNVNRKPLALLQGGREERKAG